MDVSFSHPILLGNLAQLAWEDGDHPRSASLTVEALGFGRTVRNAFVVANTLDIAVKHVIRAGRAHTAARLLGAADVLRLRVGVPVEPQNVAERQSLLMQVQGLLGDVAWAQARVEGESLSLDQAITEAMES